MYSWVELQHGDAAVSLRIPSHPTGTAIHPSVHRARYCVTTGVILKRGGAAGTCSPSSATAVALAWMDGTRCDDTVLSSIRLCSLQSNYHAMNSTWVGRSRLRIQFNGTHCIWTEGILDIRRKYIVQQNTIVTLATLLRLINCCFIIIIIIIIIN